MKQFIKDFKAFAMRGNVLDLAVAVVIGSAFGKIVSSLVENIITPLLGILLGGVNFVNFSITFDKAVIHYGIFLQNIFDFIIIALSIFIVIKMLAKFKKQEAKKENTKEEILLLREIRDSLKK